MPILEQITDHRGNSFKPTADQSRLYKAGWRLVERKKVGCMWIVRWVDMHDESGQVWSQGTAIEILNSRKK
jgi:hypothetical protein